MTEINAYPPGTFCWIDLAATDTEGAKKFYAGLFGWRARDIPVGPGVFTMLQLGGKEIASLYQLSEQHQAQGVPAHWMSYVAVTNADETAARVNSLRGRVLVSPFDVPDLGRMALIQDPTGALLAVWQAGNHVGARLIKQPGTLTWTELITPDPAQAGQFYTQLFGWDIQTHDRDTTFSNRDQKIAGMRQMTEEWGDMWPQWRVYFAVADCDASADKARALGGEVIMSPAGIPPFGRYALIKDTQGAVFSIVKPTNLLCEM
jgi:predicted enzyme related to lactoylglutathione lyase